MKHYILNSFLHPLLSNYKIYRKWIGGEWRRKYIDYAYNDIWFLKSDPIPVFSRGSTFHEYYVKETLSFNQLKTGKLYQIVSGYEVIRLRDKNGEEVGFVNLNEPILYLGFDDHGTIETDFGQIITLEYKFLTCCGLIGFVGTNSDIGFIAAEIL